MSNIKIAPWLAGYSFTTQHISYAMEIIKAVFTIDPFYEYQPYKRIQIREGAVGRFLWGKSK